MSRLAIALDVMGGDLGPSVTVPAALQALILNPKINIILVGIEKEIIPLLKNIDSSLYTRIEIISVDKVIANSITTSQGIRQSVGTSMRIALTLVKEGRANACISAGNTGVLMGLATLLLKPLPGIERPALVTTLPNQQRGKTLVLDLGANVICDSKMLVQFAVMGAVMAEQILHIDAPRVALLNIGEEEYKGLTHIRNAAELLKDIKFINYIGYLEGNELLTGKTDVLVCDGFTGNVTLKTLEGVARVFLSLGKSSENGKRILWWSKLMKWWLQKKFVERFGSLHPDQYNGASLLGLNGIVIKSHGAANQTAFTAAIKQAVQTVERRVPDKIAARLATVLIKSG